MTTSTQTQNILDFTTFKKSKLGFFSLCIHPLQSIRIIQKVKRIPENFLSVFDQEDYLSVNDDIQKALDTHIYSSALEHLIYFGYSEIQEGKRRIGKAFPFFEEKAYLTENPDVKEAVKRGSFLSGFDHFIHFGYQEFRKKTRKLSGTYPLEWTGTFKSDMQHHFNASSYLEANSDIDEAIAKGQFHDAWEHFISHGADEIRKGNRALYPYTPIIAEEDYVWEQKDIFDATLYPHVSTPFEHFLRYGAEELRMGERTIAKRNQYVYKDATQTEAIQNTLKNFIQKPLLSVIMPVYNVDIKWLKLAIESLKNQWYTHWELCIADDASTKEETIQYLKSINDKKIKIIFMKKNLNISGASNEALKLARGEYIALMDNDDELTPDALYEVVKAINEQEAEFIYSDEDKLELDGTYSDPHFKPDFAPDMFLSQNYLSHLGVIKTKLITKVNGWEVGLEGAQDYDLYLKVLEHTDKIVHIPKVLYHWRKIEGSTATEFSEKSYAKEAGAMALRNAMHRRNINATVAYGKYPGTYKITYKIKNNPLVSIVIPYKDKPELLKMSIESVLNKSTYKNFEIIGMSNNSEEQGTFDEMKRLETLDKRVKFHEYNVPFNYSEINNYAVKHFAKGEHIVLMNNDIKIISENWIEEMLIHSQRERVGAVGAKLYYPDDTIQHAGVSIGVLALAGHNFRHQPKDTPAYMGRESVVQNVSAVTAALLMVKKHIFNEVGGLDENHLKIAFNDIDFCLSIQRNGYVNIFTPWAEAYHYESVSRGTENTPEKQQRFNKEVNFMQKKWDKILTAGDPYYNVNLTLETENFSYRKING